MNYKEEEKRLRNILFQRVRGGKLNSMVMVNKSIDKIEEARESLMSKNIKPTQKKVSEISGLSLSTVKRHWKKKPIDIDKELEKINKEFEEEDDRKYIDEVIEIKDGFQIEGYDVKVEDNKLTIRVHHSV